MITLEQYFGEKINSPDATPERIGRAGATIGLVNKLLSRAVAEGVYAEPIDADTGTQISGSHAGYGDGGFRLSTSKTGGPGSKHREGGAVDVYDPGDFLDDWLTNEILEEYGLYREAPESTPGWCHLQSISPHSGHRTFIP
jgi:hypothetical protein